MLLVILLAVDYLLSVALSCPVCACRTPTQSFIQVISCVLQTSEEAKSSFDVKVHLHTSCAACSLACDRAQMEALEQLRDQAGAAFEELFSEIRAKMAAAQEQAGILDSLRGFAAAVNWKVQQTCDFTLCLY